jgi:hypothetical protein
MKLYIFTVLMLLLAAITQAQDELAGESEAAERVQYTLILPDEKTPETIKDDENNPFEAVADEKLKEGDTEENRVRDILLSMPAKGGGSGPSGMRVMLGSMRLEAGQMVPEVLPDQQVKLMVKAITAKQIEMVWVEKKPTGLPPKPFVLDVDVSPRIRYLMPSGTGTTGGSGLGTIRMDGLSAFSREDTPPIAAAADEEVAPVRALAVEDKPAADKAPAAAAPPPSSNVPEASVLRMLFGNHAGKKPADQPPPPAEPKSR